LTCGGFGPQRPPAAGLPPASPLGPDSRPLFLASTT